MCVYILTNQKDPFKVLSSVFIQWYIQYVLNTAYYPTVTIQDD